MKHIQVAIPLLTLLTLPSPAHASSAKFRQLVEAAGPEAALCDKFTQDRKQALARINDQVVTGKFLNREDAFAALSLLEARPGTGPRAREAGAYFRAHAEDLLATWNPLSDIANLANATKFPRECEPLLPLRVLPALFKCQGPLRFSEPERNRVLANLKTYLSEAREPNFGILSIAIRGSILQSYLEDAYQGANREELVAEAHALDKSFESERSALYQERGKWLGQWKEVTGRTALKELAWHQRYLSRYEALVARVFPTSLC